MKFEDIKKFHTPNLYDYPKSNNYVKDDALDKLKVKFDEALGEGCFLNYMTTDEKPYQDLEKFMVRKLNRKINSLRSHNHRYRRYIRLLHRIINHRDREIRELKRSRVVVNINNVSKRKYGHVSSTTRLMRLIKSRSENKEE
jgi:hypothetical protein